MQSAVESGAAARRPFLQCGGRGIHEGFRGNRLLVVELHRSGLRASAEMQPGESAATREAEILVAFGFDTTAIWKGQERNQRACLRQALFPVAESSRQPHYPGYQQVTEIAPMLLERRPGRHSKA